MKKTIKIGLIAIILALAVFFYFWNTNTPEEYKKHYILKQKIEKLEKTIKKENEELKNLKKEKNILEKKILGKNQTQENIENLDLENFDGKEELEKFKKELEKEDEKFYQDLFNEIKKKNPKFSKTDFYEITGKIIK